MTVPKPTTSSGQKFNSWKKVELVGNTGIIRKAPYQEVRKSQQYPNGRTQNIMDIELNGVIKDWTPNGTTYKELFDQLGENENSWIGKSLLFSDEVRDVPTQTGIKKQYILVAKVLGNVSKSTSTSSSVDKQLVKSAQALVDKKIAKDIAEAIDMLQNA